MSAEADGTAPAAQPAGLSGVSGSASALARVENWHHDVVAQVDGWVWIRTLNDQLTVDVSALAWSVFLPLCPSCRLVAAAAAPVSSGSAIVSSPMSDFGATLPTAGAVVPTARSPSGGMALAPEHTISASRICASRL